MIRNATAADVPAMVEMAREFIAASGSDIVFDADYLGGSFRSMLADGTKLVLVLDLGQVRGMLCAGVSRSPWEPIGQASELLFWIDPQSRGRHARAMLEAYIDWARGMGCKRASMVGLTALTSTDSLYRKAGFEPTETNYMRAI